MQPDISPFLPDNLPTFVSWDEILEPQSIVDNYFVGNDLKTVREFLWRIFSVAMCANDGILGVDEPNGRANFSNPYEELMQFIEAYFWLHQPEKEARRKGIVAGEQETT